MVHEPVISIQSDEKIIKKSVYLFILDIQDRGEIKQICDINNQKCVGNIVTNYQKKELIF